MRILVVDDEHGQADSLARLLQLEGYDVAAETSPVKALERAAHEHFDLMLSDVRMPNMDGLELLRRYKAQGGTALVIMMSAYGGEDAAIQAMKEGAYDYLHKPFRPDEVLLTLRKAEEREQLRGRVASLEAELARWTDRDLVAQSPAMRNVIELATRVAPHTTTLLITGESGTGKEVLARKIHAMSPRRDKPFVAVNCAAIPDALLESELFGHVKGAFTGATTDRLGLYQEADGGTLLLDEIGDLPMALQVKLLRVLQEGEIRRLGGDRPRKVDVRVMAATAKELDREVRQGHFREDLYYRLNVVRLHIPPLRERPEDVDGLVAALLERSIQRTGGNVTMTPEALGIIRHQSWPGNVRELENAIERAVVLSPDGVLRPEAFVDAPGDHSGGPGPPGSGPGGGSGSLKAAVERAERDAIEGALAATHGNRARAARLLGVSRTNLIAKLKKYGMQESR